MATRILAALIIGCFLLTPRVYAQLEGRPLTAAPLKPDVRVLIDVSGSMRGNDPQNLRRPAVELLVKLLPEGSRAGIWAFGDMPRPLVEYGQVTDLWRALASEQARTIDSRTLFTNIGAALEAAAAAGPAGAGYRTSVVLLTDGMVDVAKDPDVNRREWQRIAKQLLPRLHQAGFTLHTIALSDNADQDLLNRLALRTGGVAAVAGDAEQLMPIFLKILDIAAPSDQVILEDTRFRIDASVEEFTALIFRDDEEQVTRLRNPEGRALAPGGTAANVRWHRTNDYDLITVKAPQAGDWTVLAEVAPDSRISIVSNLGLRVRELPTNVFEGQTLPVSFALMEAGEIIARAEFLSLMSFNLELQRLGEGGYTRIWRTAVSGENPPLSGIFNAQLPEFADSGDYRLLVTVDGKSFERKLAHHFSVRMPFQADLVGKTDAEGGYYALVLRSHSAGIDADKTQVVATLLTPENRKRIRPMELTDAGQWELKLQPSDIGRYQVRIAVNGRDSNDIKFAYQLDELSFYYSPERGLIREAAGEAPVVLALPEPEPEPMVEPEAEPLALSPEATPADAVVQSAPEPQGHNWLLYAVLAGGNLLLLGAGFWAYRYIMSRERSAQEILAQFDERLEPEPDAPAPVDAGSVAAFTPAEPEPDLADKPIPEEPQPAPPQAEPTAEPLAQTGDAIDDASLNEALASIMGDWPPEEDGELQDGEGEQAEDAFSFSESELEAETDDGENRP